MTSPFPSAWHAGLDGSREDRRREMLERLNVAKTCPFNPVHGGCHYPDCTDDCPGRANALPSQDRAK